MNRWPAIDRNEFRNIISDLYSSHDNTIRFLEDAGLKRKNITISSEVINTWHNVIQQSTNRQLDIFARLSSEEHPNNKQLLRFMPSLEDLAQSINKIIDDIKHCETLVGALKDLSDLAQDQEHPRITEIRQSCTQLMTQHTFIDKALYSNAPSQASRIFLENIKTRALELCALLQDKTAPFALTAPEPPPSDLLSREGIMKLRTESQHSTSNDIEPNPNALLYARSICKVFIAPDFSLGFIDLTALPGDIIGIVGANGSGKSVLLEILRGELAHDSGLLCYPAISGRNKLIDWKKVRLAIGYVAQRSHKWRGTLKMNLEYAAATLGKKSEDADRIIARYGLAMHANKQWTQLSAGFRMRADLVLSLLKDLRLLILDEPLANLDLSSQQEFMRDIAALAKSGVAIVLTSQHLFEIEAIASEVIFLCEGRIADARTKDAPSVFEIWWPGSRTSTLSYIMNALKALKPRSIKISTTAVFVKLAPGTTLEDIVSAAQKGGIDIVYARDITHSAKSLIENLVGAA